MMGRLKIEIKNDLKKLIGKEIKPLKKSKKRQKLQEFCVKYVTINVTI
jgi:hypothetical protein